MLNARAVASVLLVLVVMLAGCVSEETVAEPFPEFALEDGDQRHGQQEHDGR